MKSKINKAKKKEQLISLIRKYGRVSDKHLSVTNSNWTINNNRCKDIYRGRVDLTNYPKFSIIILIGWKI